MGYWSSKSNLKRLQNQRDKDRIVRKLNLSLQFFRIRGGKRGEKWRIGNKGKDKKVTLRIAETNPKFVGRGVALLDPKIMDDLCLLWMIYLQGM